MEGSSERRRSCNAATLAAQLVFVVVVVVGGVCSLLSLLFLNERARGSCAQNYLSTKKTKKTRTRKLKPQIKCKERKAREEAIGLISSVLYRFSLRLFFFWFLQK